IVFAGDPKKRLLPRPAGEVATPDLIRGSRRGQERPLVPRYAESLLIPRAFHRARAPPPPPSPWFPPPPPPGGGPPRGGRTGAPPNRPPPPRGSRRPRRRPRRGGCVR